MTMCSGNLGDFANSLPVISGLSKFIGSRINLILRNDTVKFNGIKEFLMYQSCIDRVYFDNDPKIKDLSKILHVREAGYIHQNNNNRPHVTRLIESWIKDTYKIPFEVDDAFELKIEDRTIDISNRYIIGDRSDKLSSDRRRSSNMIRHRANPDESKVQYLDYSNSIMHNLNIIIKSSKPFITTFTGIGVLADLMNKETIVCWDEDIRIWPPENGHDIQYTFNRHHYADRKAKLLHVKDLLTELK